MDNQRGRYTDKRLRAAENRERALRMRLAKASYEQIAKELGVTVSMIHKYLKQGLKMINDKCPVHAEQIRHEELAKLDAMEAGITMAALSGDLSAINAVLSIQNRRTRLLGLDQPEKQEQIGEMKYTIRFVEEPKKEKRENEE